MNFLERRKQKTQRSIFKNPTFHSLPLYRYHHPFVFPQKHHAQHKVRYRSDIPSSLIASYLVGWLAGFLVGKLLCPPAAPLLGSLYGRSTAPHGRRCAALLPITCCLPLLRRATVRMDCPLLGPMAYVLLPGACFVASAVCS